MAAFSMLPLTEVRKWIPQEMANTAWSLATLSITDEQLLFAADMQDAKRISKFSTQHLSNTVWSFATLVVVHGNLSPSALDPEDRKPKVDLHGHGSSSLPGASSSSNLSVEGELHYTPDEIAAALEPHGFRHEKLAHGPHSPDGTVNVAALSESAFHGNGCCGVLVHANGRYLACIKGKNGEGITVRDVLEDETAGRIVSEVEFADLVSRFPSFSIYGAQ
eukprot:gnl/MRDRNA2_/MRDRNA2_86656_c0_seq4.p1 gnl/MRDRNA2_/MRDRNA2_86656_c0~~gnl/MRDRNA2_/MRDRNA2_86656_c0_seq4.p1  ORF type:complete len:220 (+),score=35.11 gnl/MRDRNA2_/MRDRNA2_86656_c0_seq4:85-744(+)